MRDDFPLVINWSALEASQRELEAFIKFLGPSEFPEYHAAAEQVATRAEILYRSYLTGTALPSGKAVKRPTGSTARGVRRDETALLVWTISNEAPAAKALEEGTSEYDLKKMLATAKRARKSKKGNLYLVIPFRSGIPGARGLNSMPKEVYGLAKSMTRSRIQGAPSTRESATGYTVPKWTYSWNGRLTAASIAQAGGDAAAQRRFQGMVRMGTKGHTTYMTFRVMSQASPPESWIRPAVAGLWPLRTAIDQAFSDGRDALERALEADIAGALGTALNA